LSAAALAVILCRGVVLADGASREAAQRLANQALDERKKADRLETGWQEVYDHGIELANQAIALDPSVADAHYALFVNLGKKSERTGVGSQFMNISRLKALLNKTLELDPQHAHAWEAKGEMLLRLPRLWGGSASEGEQALRHAAELAPRWPKPQLRLAELDWKKGRAAEARAEAERARELARDSGETDLLRDAEALLNKTAGP
jgi:tetratricopeptide (TPR) repeat protein